MNTRRLSRDEIGQRGSQIYRDKLQGSFETSDHGSFVAIDVETEEHELADEALIASTRLWRRCPDAQVYVERVGYPVAFHAYRIARSAKHS